MAENFDIRVGLQQSNPVLCEECENDTFVEVSYIRRISKVLTASPEDTLVPLPTYACSKCGHINKALKISFGEEKKPVIEK